MSAKPSLLGHALFREDRRVLGLGGEPDPLRLPGNRLHLARSRGAYLPREAFTSAAPIRKTVFEVPGAPSG